MDIDFSGFDRVHFLGESATHPIRPPSGALAALLVLADRAKRRPRALASPPDDGLLGRVQLPFL